MHLLISGECVSRHTCMHACGTCVNAGCMHACMCRSSVYICSRISDVCVYIVCLITHVTCPISGCFFNQTWKSVSRRYGFWVLCRDLHIRF